MCRDSVACQRVEPTADDWRIVTSGTKPAGPSGLLERFPDRRSMPVKA
nr:MAG TPA: hypothetical protein [Caudoviricetes sp.]